MKHLYASLLFAVFTSVVASAQTRTFDYDGMRYATDNYTTVTLLGPVDPTATTAVIPSEIDYPTADGNYRFIVKEIADSAFVGTSVETVVFDPIVSSATLTYGGLEMGQAAFATPTIKEIVFNRTEIDGPEDAFLEETYAQADMTFGPEVSTDDALTMLEQSPWNQFSDAQAITTAIGSVEYAAAAAPTGIYTISGRRVNAPFRGLYIIDGRKTLVK